MKLGPDLERRLHTWHAEFLRLGEPTPPTGMVWPRASKSVEALMRDLPGKPLRAGDKIIGGIGELALLDGHLVGEVHVVEEDLHRALSVAEANGRLGSVIGLAVDARVLTEPMVVFGRGHWGERVSEGIAPVAVGVTELRGVQLVAHWRGMGRFLRPAAGAVRWGSTQS